MIEVVLEKLSSSEISKLQKTATPQISLLSDIEKQKINTHKNIYRSILPIIDENLELQVSSFDNDKGMKKREDIINDGDYREDITMNAPNSEEGFFLVPKVID